ncbi:MAG: hypothetical protein Q4D77_02760 [Peptostreptococcaceae bacterium]|nr:hypothetical protein [Peptostreptococcaceae bacterium]
MKGSTILMIASVVMCVLGGLALFIFGLGLLLVLSSGGAFGFVVLLLALLPLAMVVFYFWSGYLGIQACRYGQGFDRCVFFGKILVGLQIVSVIIELLGDERKIGSLIISSLIVGLYLYGAIRAQEEENEYY